jgi:hypothetical protein
MPSSLGATDSRATNWLARRLHAWARVAPAHWVAFLVFAILALEPVRAAAVNGRRTAILVWLVALVLAYLWRSRPVLIAAVIVVTSALLRLHFLGIGFADQITVSQSAWEWVVAGGNPYGIGYESTIPPGAPFPYGPLGLVWWLPGPIIEFAAAIAIMLLLAWRRAWLTLAVMAGWHQSIHLTFVGINDYSPGLLILLAVLLLPTHPRTAGATLAVAAALKPYAAAWFLPFVGAGGIAAAVGLIGLSLVLWSPLLLVWGIPSFLRSMELASVIHPVWSGNTLDMPVLRWLAAPIAVAGLLARRWEFAVLIGALAFVVYLFTQHWASHGYWMAVIPAGGLALESVWRHALSATPSVETSATTRVPFMKPRSSLSPADEEI